MRARSSYFLAVLFTFFVFATVAWTALAAPASPSGSASNPAWTDLHGPRGGPAQALALNPDYPADLTVLAGGGRDVGHASWSGAGVFRSLDGGLTWPDQGGPANGALLDVAFSPAWAEDGFAVAGFWQGVWSTNDRGATWHELTGLQAGGVALVSAVAVSPRVDNAHTLLAGSSYGGIRRSADDGATWTYVGGPSAVRRLAFHPLQPAVALAATSNGLWRSADAGISWTRVTTETQIFDVAFAANGSAAYATYLSHIWRSEDSGLTWRQFTGLTVDFLDSIGLSADGAGLFTAARGTLFRYAPSAGEFVTVTTNLATGYILRLAPSPTYAADQTLLASTYDGVWISQDGGAAFALSDGFFALPVYTLAATTNDVNDGDFFAAGEYGVWRRRGGEWLPINTGLFGGSAAYVSDLAVSPAYAADGTLFTTQASSVSVGTALFKSTDRAATWRYVKSAGYISQIELSPAFPTDRRAFMVADQRVLTSTDAGETWTAQPVWTFAQTARLLAVSPNFVTNQTVYVVGNQAYRSTDAGDTWQPASAPPPITDSSQPIWTPRRLVVDANDRLFLAIYVYDMAESYARHDQVWSSIDGGDTWSIVTRAPDLPVAALAPGPSAGGGSALYMSTFDDNDLDDRVVPPDLYRSAGDDAPWQNLGELPNALPANALLAPGASDQLLAGGHGVWLFAPSSAPTATPNPCQDLLRNRSFENEGDWRIPLTAYSAARTTDRHYHGSWSMRTGIVAAGDNVRSYSDFSQDVILPNLPQTTLRYQRWPQAAATTSRSADALAAILAATTLEEFQQRLAATTGDLQYGMVIAPPGGTIHFLYARLDDNRVWVSESFDLSAYRGQTVRLQFGTYNDGVGAQAAQFFDAMSLEVCAAPPTATPTATPAATGTATPTSTPAATETATPLDPVRTWLPVIEKDGGGTIPQP